MRNRNTGLEDVVLSVLNTGGRPTKEPNGQESKGGECLDRKKKLSVHSKKELQMPTTLQVWRTVRADQIGRKRDIYKDALHLKLAPIPDLLSQRVLIQFSFYWEIVFYYQGKRKKSFQLEIT